jgi:parvulin-like peptidyl-prolyl isomerase
MAKSKQNQSATGKRSSQKAEPAESARQTKKQIAFSRKQAKQNRIIYIGLAAVGAVILLVLAIGLIQEMVVKPAAPVARVNGTKIAKDEFEDLLQFRRYTTHINILNLQNQLRNIDSSDPNNQFLASIYEQQLNQAQASLGLLPDETLDALIEDALIQEKAQEAELSVTDQEVVETIEEDLRLAVAPPPQAPITDTQEIETPTPVPQEELDQVYASALENMGLSERQYQEIVKRGMLRDKVQEFLASQVITTGLVVHLQIIETDAEEQATAALERVESGEDFAVVATEVSTDTLSVNDGGDLGWVTTGQLSPRYGQELETQALSAEVGKPAIVQSGDQFYVYLVVERDENGPLPADVLSQRQATAIFDWLEERKASPEVEIERLLDPAAVPADPFEAVSGG